MAYNNALKSQVIVRCALQHKPDLLSIVPIKEIQAFPVSLNFAAGMLSIKRGLAPIARKDARILVLASLPSDASLAAGQYYAYPQNQFWKLVSGIAQQDLIAMEYAQRVAALHSAGIALWDVIGTAHRQGSLDQKIRGAQVNALQEFIAKLPKLGVAALNGKKARALAGNALDGLLIDILPLPSSSAAYTLDVRQKAIAWSRLASYLIT